MFPRRCVNVSNANSFCTGNCWNSHLCNKYYDVDFHSLDISSKHRNYHQTIINISSSIIFGMFAVHCVDESDVGALWCRQRFRVGTPWSLIIYCPTHFPLRIKNIISQNFHISLWHNNCMRAFVLMQHIMIRFFRHRALLILSVYLRRNSTFVSSPPPQHKHSHQMVILTAPHAPSSCL